MVVNVVEVGDVNVFRFSKELRKVFLGFTGVDDTSGSSKFILECEFFGILEV